MQDELAGDPQKGSLWVRQSLAKIRKALYEQKTKHLCCETIRRLLNKKKIRPKSNVKRLHPKPHRDRDKQFRYLLSQRDAFLKAGWPCISIDAKKKELIGDFYNRGTQWTKTAQAVNTHDFPSYAEGQARPYGIYDIARNSGYIAVGKSADTPEFAVDVISWWWQDFGKKDYLDPPELLLLADAGGSNGCRPRRWKEQLQVKIADRFGLGVTVCHYPTGASKWNPIEHRLFSQISRTWAGTPLTSYDILLDGLRQTSTRTGLAVEATLFEKVYEKGLSVTDEEMKLLIIQRHDICPNWNYTIRPRFGK